MVKSKFPRSRLLKFEEKQPKKKEEGLGLEEIIQSVANDILKSQKRIQESGGKSIFYVEKAQITISFVVKKTATGAVKLVAAEADGAYSTERINQITLELTTKPPVLDSILSQLDLSKEEALTLIKNLTQPAGE